MVIVLFVLVIIFAVAGAFFLTSGRTMSFMQTRNQATFSAQEGIERMLDEMRGNSQLTSIAPTGVKFILKGEAVVYEYDPGTRTLKRNEQIYAPEIEAFDLRYLDESGSETGVIANIRQVELSVTAKSRNESLDFITVVSFRTR